MVRGYSELQQFNYGILGTETFPEISLDIRVGWKKAAPHTRPMWRASQLCKLEWQNMIYLSEADNKEMEIQSYS